MDVSVQKAPNSRRSAGRTIVEILAVAAVYNLGSYLGRAVVPPPAIPTVVWPPSGLALAALLILGDRVWFGVWLGAFLSNDWARADPSHASAFASFLAVSMGIDTGSLLQSLAGAALVRRFIGSTNPFQRFRHTVVFVLIALLMGLVGATGGAVSLCLGRMLSWSAVLHRGWTWWIGDSCGVLVFAPLILVWWHSRRPRWDRARWIEAAAIFAVVTLCAIATFVWWHPTPEEQYPADLLILPLMTWVAFRFTQREVTLLVPVVLAIALWGTVHGAGPYGSSQASTLPVMQAFIGILCIFSLSIGALITERRQAEQALLESERWLKESQRISRTGSFVLDIDNGVWSSSEALDEILGIDRSCDRKLETWTNLIHPDDRPAIAQCLGRRRAFDREYRIVNAKTGASHWVYGRVALYPDSEGRPTMLAGTIQDITERNHLEGQLRQAQKMESIGRLAGGVAHDFNNLLTVINGYGDLVLSKMQPHDPVYRYVAEIRKSGSRAAELTSQLLAFSRRQVLQPVVLNLNDIVHDSEQILRRIIGEDIELVCCLAPELSAVEADPGQIHQVVMNLAVNARDAMPDGGTLTIATANSPDGTVSLTVSDDGIGMDPVTIEHAFEPFFTTKDMGKGTGLGLATVHGIVEQSGGSISVSSQIGHGTVFTVRLRGVDKPQPFIAGEEPSRGGSETILLVEDQLEVRRFLTETLENGGYRVLPAADGEEALRICQNLETPVDLVVTDVIMPRMKGYELAAHLRQSFPSLPILFVTGHTDPSILDRVRFGGGAHLLHKPFAPGGLVRKVREIFEQL